MAITAEMGNRTLMQAIQVACHEMEGIEDHLGHFASNFDILLGYRKFFVHSAFGITPDGGNRGEFERQLFSLDGKGRSRYFSQKLTQAKLQEASKSVQSLIGYGVAIQQDLGVAHNAISRLAQSYEVLLEKPHWPRTIEQTPLYF